MLLITGIRSMLCRIFYLHVKERLGEMRIVVERDCGEQGETHRDARKAVRTNDFKRNRKRKTNT